MSIEINRTRSSTFLYLGLIVVTGFALRVMNYGDVFYNDLVIFPGYDPYYHMTRIFRVMSDWPTVPAFDPAMNFPYGAVIIWPPLFDFAIATLCLSVGLTPTDIYEVERLAAFTTPAIGALTAVPTYLLAEKILGKRGPALFASLFLMLTPAHIWYSALGFVDHHASVTLIQVTMFYFFLQAAEALEENKKTSVKLWWLGAAAICLTTGMLVWNGYIFYVAILDLFLLILLLLDGRWPGSQLPTLLWGTHLTAAFLLAPFVFATVSAGGGPFAAITLSWFHIGAIGGAGLFGLLYKGYFSSTVRSLSPALRVAGLALIIALIATPPLILIDTIKEGLGWVFTKDPFMSQVSESQPIFIYNGQFDLAATINGITIFIFLAPIMMILAMVEPLKDRWDRRKRLFLLLWVGALFLVTLKQRRFAEAFSPAQAILIACFIPIFINSFMEHSFFSRLRAKSVRRISWAIICSLVIVSLWPFLSNKVIEKMTAVAEPPPATRTYTELLEFRKFLFPDKPKENGKVVTIEYGVVNPWDFGHQIMYITGLPVVSNNFGLHIGIDSYNDWSFVFLTKEEKAAISILEKRRIKYVITNDSIFTAYAAMLAQGENVDNFYKTISSAKSIHFSYQPELIVSVLFRLQKLDGSARLVANQMGYSFTVPALTRFRLIFDKSIEKKKGQLKVFEFVKGARLMITGGAKEHVEVSYNFTTSNGGKKIYKQSLTTNSDGVARSIVPYPSDRPDLRFSSSYLISGKSGTTRLFVPEKAVQEGGLLSVDISSP